MKTISKKLVVLICALVLAVMPVSSAFAATNSTPVLIQDAYGVKEYQFQPSPLDAYSGQVIYLMDNGSVWNVPAGHDFTFMFNGDGNFNVKIFKVGYGFVYDEYVTNWFSYSAPADQQDTSYIVFVVAQSTVMLYNYAVFRL